MQLLCSYHLDKIQIVIDSKSNQDEILYSVQGTYHTATNEKENNYTYS
jgi:hypothetical protein